MQNKEKSGGFRVFGADRVAELVVEVVGRDESGRPIVKYYRRAKK